MKLSTCVKHWIFYSGPESIYVKHFATVGVQPTQQPSSLQVWQLCQLDSTQSLLNWKDFLKHLKSKHIFIAVIDLYCKPIIDLLQ